MQNVLNQPAANVDVAGTFKSARSACLSTDFSQLFVYVADGEKQVFALLSTMERVGLMDLVIDGWRRLLKVHQVYLLDGTRRYV